MSETTGDGGAGGEGVQPQASDVGSDANDKNTPDATDRDPLGGESPEKLQAYASGRYSLGGPAINVEQARAGRDFSVGDTYNLVFGRYTAPSPGPVRSDVLERIRSHYTPVAGYDRILATLTDRRLVVLRGFRGTGRATTALHALDEVAHGKVVRLDMAEELTPIQEKDLENGHGYLIELIYVGAARSLTQTQLDGLSDLLGRCGCYCVVLTEHSPRHRDILDTYLLDCPQPAPDALLARYVAQEMRVDDRDGLEHELLERAGQQSLRSAVGPRPRPVETLQLAGLLVEHGRDKITLDQVEAGCADFVPRQVAEWFADLHGLRRSDAADYRLRLAGFRIALAVFNESPYHIVREAGEVLAEELIRTLWPKRVPGRPLSTSGQETWLAAARAKLVDGHWIMGDARVPIHLVAYEDVRYARAVLSHVWLCHHNMREPLLRWLRQQSRVPRDSVWVRAAQVAGLLCVLDFPYTFHNVINPAAESDDRVERRFAAVALDQAALDDQVRPMIAEYFKSWVGGSKSWARGSPEQQWTMANALGYEVGLQSIEDSLEWLKILGTRVETRPEMDPDLQQELLVVSGRSLAKLFAAGASRPVLDRLIQWIEPRQRHSLHELASWAILTVAYTYIYDLHLNALLHRSVLAAGTGREWETLFRERKHWPALLALQDKDAEFTGPVADLLTHALRSSRGVTAEWVLGQWMRAGQRDRTCLVALTRFLRHLVRTEGDRRRLRYLVKSLRRDWAEPLREEVATQLDAAMDHPVVQEKPNERVATAR